MNPDIELVDDVEELLHFNLIPSREAFHSILKCNIGIAIEKVSINSYSYTIELRNCSPNSVNEDKDREKLRNYILDFLNRMETYSFLLLDADTEVLDNRVRLTLPNYWIGSISKGADGADELMELMS